MSFISPVSIFQTCSDILDSMAAGEFGSAGRSATDGFRSRCAKLFPHSVKFRPPQQQQQQTTVCLSSGEVFKDEKIQWHSCIDIGNNSLGRPGKIFFKETRAFLNSPKFWNRIS